jgi:hypothetical protein
MAGNLSAIVYLSLREIDEAILCRAMVDPSLPTNVQLASIHERVDFIFNAGFDFITTESGKHATGARST